MHKKTASLLARLNKEVITIFEIINIIIGAIGCITGSVSLFFIIRQHSFDKGKTIVTLGEQKPPSYSSYFNPNEFHIQTYNSECGAALSLVITNKSSYPISINEIFAINKKKQIYHDQDFKFQPLNLAINESSFIEISFIPSTALPFKMEPFETKCIGVRLPFFSKFITNYGEEVKFKVKLITSRKPVEIYASIPEVHSFLEDFKNTNNDTGNTANGTN